MRIEKNLRLICYLREEKKLSFLQIAERLKQDGLVGDCLSVQEMANSIEKLYQGTVKHISSMDRIGDLYQKGYTIEEIDQKLEGIGKTKIINGVMNHYAKQAKQISTTEILLRDAILSGKTIPSYTNDEQLQFGMKMMLKRLKQTTSNCQGFEKILNYMEGTEGFSHIRSYESKIERYVKRGILPTGQLQVIQQTHFEDNIFDFIYIFNHLSKSKGIRLSVYDQEVQHIYQQKLAKEIDKRFERIKQRSGRKNGMNRNVSDREG